MFEARLTMGSLLKKLVDAVKELVTDVNFDVSAAGIACQAMDTSHVCLISVLLRAEGFEHFRCDRPRSIGLSLKSLAAVLKCMGNDDTLTMKADDDGDKLTLMFEAPDQARVADFEMKLMEIDQEQLGIPDNEYSAQVKMPSAEFQRLVKDLSAIGENVNISVAKDGIKFAATGDIGTANITVRHNPHADKKGQQTVVDLQEPVSLNFAMRYLVNFSKASPLSEHVVLTLTKDLPIQVEFLLQDAGHIRYYLAPKIDDDEGDAGMADAE
uniref:DNA sliding clamp PCNA n=1 Tax=Chlamydomonas leiostraca TaxID=1034604 RepID=A0A7S0RT56_9CHLO|mmetsp:Transcript_30942/g.78973  ORF Transcript_30942/g.78973 Transcript_30942/m.78973 type:complete len:269 (+) Transcript_30942:36-842(+)